MNFINRLGYYLGGFTIGIIILMFFLNGKDASCSYSPNARTIKNITSKKLNLANDVKSIIASNNIDSTIVKELIAFGDVDFSNSDTKSKPCKTYKIGNTYKERLVNLKVKNCDSIATVTEFTIEN